MMTNNRARMLEAHPDARHPRVTVGIREVDLPVDENIRVIRAPRRQNKRRENDDLNDRDGRTSHADVLVENSKSE
jgi:hypothetical protein